jgi:hypothetical protein
MASTINVGAGLGNGQIVKTADSSGILTLQSNTTDSLTINTLQNPTLNSTGSITIPSGTTAQRPASPVSGMLRYNTTVSNMEIYINGSWVTLT